MTKTLPRTRKTLVTLLVLISLVSCYQCATLRTSAESGRLSETIAYYDRYIEGAVQWVALASIIPALTPYTTLASSLLLMIDAALDQARVLADAYRENTITEAQVAESLDRIHSLIVDFNSIAAQIRALLPQTATPSGA